MSETDPTRYDDTISDKDTKHWHCAMDSEIDKVYKNCVWEPVEEHDDIKSIHTVQIVHHNTKSSKVEYRL